MIGAPNSLNLSCKVRVRKEAPGPSVSEEIADIFRNYNIDSWFLFVPVRFSLYELSQRNAHVHTNGSYGKLHNL